MENTNSRKCNVLLGCTGSVASIKVPEIVRELHAFEHMVCIDVSLSNFISFRVSLKADRTTTIQTGTLDHDNYDC